MRHRNLFFAGILAAALLLVTHTGLARAEVKLPPFISSHMVLQRGMPVPIWGTAAPGEKVSVKFRDQEKTNVAGPNGHWLVKLDKLDLGDPGTLVIAGTNTITCQDVLVGDVWIGSGQSNMEIGVNFFAKGDPDLAKLAAEKYPQIRLARVNVAWRIASPEVNTSFSALLFAFGVNLHRELKVPIGLIVGAVGGTPSGYWVTEEMLKADPDFQAAVTKWDAANPIEPREEKYQKDLAAFTLEKTKWDEDAAAAKAATTQPAPATLGSTAPPATVAKKKSGPVPPVRPLRAGTNAGNTGYLYKIHIQPLQPYAIRGVVWDQGESNTNLMGIDQYTTMGALIRGWRAAWGQGEFPFIYVQKPSGGGCAWDPTDPVTSKADKFAALPAQANGDGLFREIHIHIMQYPATAMVQASDLGPGTHPVNKAGYGARAARVALGMAYGQKIEYYGPIYASHKIDGAAIRVTFSHVGQGLAFKGGDKLQGFAVAGADKVFHWAAATIDGDAVVVQSDQVPQPVAVRYAWSGPIPWANLFNKDGLPALTFRTDNW